MAAVKLKRRLALAFPPAQNVAAGPVRQPVRRGGELMLKGINYWAFVPMAGEPPLNPLEAMRYARELGYDSFELTVEAEGMLSLSTTRADAERIRKEAEKIGILLPTLASGLAWSASPTHPKAEVRDKAASHSLKVIEIASWLGVKTVLYLPGMVSASFVPDFEPQPYDAVDQRAREALKRIIPTAEKLGITLGVENVWNRYLLSPLEMRDFIDSFQSPHVRSYFDVGNVMLYGHPEHWIAILGKRIAAVHMKDFRVSVGGLGGFVDLLAGDVDYRKVMKAFREIGFTDAFTAEIAPGAPGAVEKALAALKLIEKL
jgi:L-ribulose-5-phosphate 3-epimerase